MLRGCVGALCFLTLAASAATARLRIGNAANGAPLETLQQQAFRFAVSGRGEISMRRVRPSEAVAALKKGEFDLLVLDARFRPPADAGVTVRPYAAEALCVYIHPGNATGSLTRAEVLEILTEPRPGWSKYSPMAADIQRVGLKSDRPEGMLVYRVFGERAFAPEVLRVGSLDQLFAFLNAASAGFGPFAAERPAEAIALPVENVTPTTATVRSGRYPLSLHYLIVTGPTGSPLLREFVSELFSPESRRKLAADGLIPIWEDVR